MDVLGHGTGYGRWGLDRFHATVVARNQVLPTTDHRELGLVSLSHPIKLT